MAILSQLLLVMVYTILTATAGVAVVMAANSAFRVNVLGVLDRLTDRIRFHCEIIRFHCEITYDDTEDFVVNVCDFLDDKTEDLGDFLVHLGDCVAEKYADIIDALSRAARAVASLFRGRRV